MVIVTLETTVTPVELKPTHPEDAVVEKTAATEEESAVISRAMIAKLPSEKLYLLNLKVPEEAFTATPSRKRHRSTNEEEVRDQPESHHGVYLHRHHGEGKKSEETPHLKKARVVVKIKRAVRFELDEDKVKIKTHVRFIDPVESDLIAELWWNKEEILEISRREKSASAVMSYCCDHYTNQVLSLMKIARGIATEDTATAPVWVASSPARGLEKEIVRGFRARKKQVIQKVLESQRVLKFGGNGGKATPEMVSRLISDQYQRWSQPMLRFAQVLANGDAQAVLEGSLLDGFC